MQVLAFFLLELKHLIYCLRRPFMERPSLRESHWGQPQGTKRNG